MPGDKTLIEGERLMWTGVTWGQTKTKTNRCARDRDLPASQPLLSAQARATKSWPGRGVSRKPQTRRRVAALLSVAAASTMIAVAVPSAATATGYVAAWGDNQYGQLGVGTTSGPESCPGACSREPVPLAGLSSEATAVASGGIHSLALLSDGTVMAWGDNTYGELGNGTTTSSDAPVAVKGLSGVTAIAAGAYHSLALLSGGTVVAWGRNESGQLGDGTMIESDEPVAVKSLTGVTAIAAGSEHSLALLSDGTVMAWGNNNLGQLGNNGMHVSRDEPVAVSGLSSVIAIAAGGANSLALLSDGTARSWGFNQDGELGDGCEGKSGKCGIAVESPVTVAGLTGATGIGVGANHSLALLGNGTVKAWGAGLSGQLGNGTKCCDRPEPVAVTGLSGVTAVAASGQSSLALVSGGALMGWGAWPGDCTTSSAVPVAVKGLGGVTAIAAGGLAVLESELSPQAECPPEPPSGLHVETTTLPDATRGVSYNAKLAASGGSPPYKWKKAGKLPKGLKLTKEGGIQGTPSSKLAPGSYAVGVKVYDSEKPKHSASATLMLKVK